MPFLRWDRLTREELGRVAAGAVTVLPVAAIEQHGPHLSTRTDAALVTAVAERACAAAGAAEATVLLAPAQCYGASDHHLPFGATLSLSTGTLRAVLADLLRSLAAAGCARVLLLNGHGGNAATCAVAAADAARTHGITVAAASYWELVEAPAGMPTPGHAGRFETSLLLAVAPDEVREEAMRPSPAEPPASRRGLRVEDPALWSRIDGFTDDPRTACAADGEALLERCVQAVADAIADLARRP